MRLEFRNRHLSISNFNPIELPDFTVLTGVNGSGKTHLLDAISQGAAEIDKIQRENIVLFNYENFRLDSEGPINGQQITQEKESVWQKYDQNIRTQANNWKNVIGDAYGQLRTECQSKGRSLWESEHASLKEYRDQVKGFFLKRQKKGDPIPLGILSMIKTLPFSIDEIRYEEFLNRYTLYTLKNNFLPNQLSRVIWDYHLKHQKNEFNKYENEKHGADKPVVGEAEFVATHGEKPWDLLNRILEKFNTLDYRVPSPDKSDLFGNYRLKLLHTQLDNTEINFEGLSSGEKVLMALVASVYKASSDQNFPDLLLLDEIDASLHPSMIKNMLDVIQEIFISRGTKVIMVTHSPTTIALAPEESIFVMKKYGKDRFEKKSKQEALNILTQGYATLDQGLRLYDEVARTNTSVITEGYNTQFIRKAIELYGLDGVEVISGVEDITGKSQLRTLFDFFSRVPHKNKVLFLWDCDANYSLKEQNNTHHYILPVNQENQIAVKGIENMFPESLFQNFKKTITRSLGQEIIQFDESRKKDFEQYVLERNNLADFVNFKALVEKIKEVKSSNQT